MKSSKGIFFFCLILNLSLINSKQIIGEIFPKFRCTVDEQELNIKYAEAISQKKEDNLKSYNLVDNVFKDFNINIDLYNFYDEIVTYGLTDKKEFFENAIMKVKQTFEKILKVKQVTNNYVIDDETIRGLKINNWDKTKIGTEAAEMDKGLKSQGIDLYVFIRFGDNSELGENTLAVAGPSVLDIDTSQPIVGTISINREVDYSKVNSFRYLESILIHEFTHVLGFLNYFFKDVYNYFYTEIGSDGVERGFVNSTKLLTIAKKYYNCDDIKGIQLEEYGGEKTAGSHWESRILLGEYMTGEIYPEEQVISEFTLALLEDLKYYQAKYITGGLMKFGKNKGCDFLNSKCVVNGKVNPKFKNEFFEVKENFFGPGCSSGRQSRAYYIILTYSNQIPEYFQYYGDKSSGGPKPIADFCPVFVDNSFGDDEEVKNIYYIGHCSEIGSGKFGADLGHNNGEIEKYTGETYSPNSFCVLSSLISKNVENYEDYLGSTRGMCYQIFCSDKSLTIKIFDDYIVCPREGGKIKAINFEGYLLCPDYYLICSATTLCNDMFDCLEKNSELKDIKYDYEIKTTQDIADAESSDFSENYYELSTNGKCPQYCTQCKTNYCLKCGDDYGIVQLKENDLNKRICMNFEDLKNGYYKNEKDSIYYQCLNNCNKCIDGEECTECKSGFELSDDKKECKEKKNNLIYVYIFVPIAVVILCLVIFFIVKAFRKSRGT